MDTYDPRTASQIFPAHTWQRSNACGPNGANCVEVNLSTDGLVGLRDTKLPHSPVLVFDNAEWDAFLSSAQAGQFRR
jgi:hypothetical protein